MALIVTKVGLAGGYYFVDFHTSQTTPAAAMSCNQGWAFANWSFTIFNLIG
jgi:hypothetical protein